MANEDNRRERELANLRAETERLRKRLVQLSGLSSRIASSLELATVFQDVVDSACELTQARFGALGIFDEAGRIGQFITHGLSDEERERIGKLPEGLGILGWLQDLQEPLRLGDLTRHPRSAGFPEHHPVMKSFLGAPIRHGEHALGNLYLSEKANGAEFTPEDENLLVLFTAQAAMAIRNAQLHRQLQELAVLEERDRIGMDLHDGVIQSLYATGLKLEACLDDVAQDPGSVAAELRTAIDQLNGVIADVRSYIYHLRPAGPLEDDFGAALSTLLQDLKLSSPMEVALEEQPGACQGLSQAQTDELLLVVRESLSNARRHARASRVVAQLEQVNGTFRLTIADNGEGFEPDRPAKGQGLRNMRERVERMGGSLTVDSQRGHGARIAVEVPITS